MFELVGLFGYYKCCLGGLRILTKPLTSDIITKMFFDSKKLLLLPMNGVFIFLIFQAWFVQQ